MASVVSDPFALLALGRYDHALQSIKNIEQRRSLTGGEQVLLIELLSLTGDVDAALSTSASVLRKQELSVSQRCRLHGAFGLSYFRKGANVKGTEQYVAGIALAEQCNLPLDECRLRVHLFRNQIHWLGPQSAAAHLMVLRRKVLNLADPAIAATFQLALTELAAKLGLHPRVDCTVRREQYPQRIVRSLLR